MTPMKWAGSDVPVLRRWCAGLVYQFAEAATKFHVNVEMRIATTYLGDRDAAPAAPLPEALSTAPAA